MNRRIPLVLLLAACGAPTGPSSEESTGVLEQGLNIPAPPNSGRYCSMTWPGGGWALASNSNLVDDPCAYIKANNGSGGTIARAGLYSATGVNDVVLRCDNGGYIQLGSGSGQGPLSWAWNQAKGHSACTFTVSPHELPIFGLPYEAGAYDSTNTGMDHARGYTVDARNDLGDPFGGVAATTVDWRGRDKSNWGYDDHQGWDFNTRGVGWQVRAVADGVVMAARYRDVSHAGPGCTYTDPSQGEVYIKHTVSGGSTTYDETFVSYYAHFAPGTISVVPGQVVTRGQVIGKSGTSGCSSGPHVHFSTFRLSNSASAYRPNFVINSNFAAGMDQNSDNGYSILLDPRGFYPARGFDPWAWRAYPWGGLSPQLWISNPPDGNW